jgi:hypothetical protein
MQASEPLDNENDEPVFLVRQYCRPPLFATARCGLREQISREGSPHPTWQRLLAYLQTG